MTTHTPATITALNTGISAGTYLAGDTVIIPAGTNTDAITFTASQVDGTAASPIIFDGQSLATLDLSANAANSHCIEIDSCDYIHFKNVDLLGSGGHGAFRVQGTATGLEAHNVNVLSNYGASDAGANHDGFSSDNSASLKIYDCDITGTRPDPQSAGGHQAIATHNTSTIEMYRGSISDSNFATAPANTSTSYLEGVTIGTCHQDVFSIIDSTVTHQTAKNCTIAIDNGGGLVGISDNTEGASITIDGGSVVATNADLQVLREGHLIWKNCNVAIDAAGWRMQLGTGARSGRVSFYNNNVTLNDASSYMFRSDIGSILEIYSNTFTGTTTDAIVSWINTTTWVRGRFAGNNVSLPGAGKKLLVSSIGTTAVPDISNNVFYACGGILLDSDNGLAVTNYNNIYHTCAVVYQTDTGILQDNNCYFNSGAIPGSDGGSSITSDPLFVDPANGDFTLQLTEDGYAADSPCRDTGFRWWAGKSNPVGIDGEPISDFKPQIGCWQHQHDAMHPTKL